ncbi:MAG: HAMP domain-containing sensor histidine kinase [Lachnospiraceae bacterium]|nr:HAMP domain-containing sensor histidine kinase [Lachnospiraceae bacterium]
MLQQKALAIPWRWGSNGAGTAKKFVIVTMSLMCITFGIFYVALSYYNKYWYDIDTLQFVRWITDSGILLNEQLDSAGRELIENDEEYNSLTAVIVSDSGKIYEYLFTGGIDDSGAPQRIIDKVLSQGKDDWKTGSYIYDIKELTDGQKLIVLADTRNGGNTPLRYVSAILLIATGIFILSLITLYFSRFVTNPAKAAMKREKQFISDASHELKTPLGAISINAQALATKGDDNKHIRNIISEAERMNRLIERLLMLSKYDETTAIMKTAFSLSSCIEEMALTYESVAYEKRIYYNYDIGGDISLYGCEDDIRQLMAILVDNAIKNTEPLGRIQISLTEIGGSIILRVNNTGRGISAEDLPHIFERFYKADSSRSDSSFGLGLAIAKAVTERNGGTISVKSEVGKITCFTVEFK